MCSIRSTDKFASSVGRAHTKVQEYQPPYLTHTGRRSYVCAGGSRWRCIGGAIAARRHGRDGVFTRAGVRTGLHGTSRTTGMQDSLPLTSQTCLYLHTLIQTVALNTHIVTRAGLARARTKTSKQPHSTHTMVKAHTATIDTMFNPMLIMCTPQTKTKKTGAISQTPNYASYEQPPDFACQIFWRALFS